MTPRAHALPIDPSISTIRIGASPARRSCRSASAAPGSSPIPAPARRTPTSARRHRGRLRRRRPPFRHRRRLRQRPLRGDSTASSSRGRRDERLPRLQVRPGGDHGRGDDRRGRRRASAGSAPTISTSTTSTGRAPAPTCARAWRALEHARPQGKIRAVGVSNFSVDADARRSRRSAASTPTSSATTSSGATPRTTSSPSASSTTSPSSPTARSAHGILTGKFGRDPDLREGDQRHRILPFRADIWPHVYEGVEKLKAIAAELDRPLMHLAHPLDPGAPRRHLGR